MIIPDEEAHQSNNYTTYWPDWVPRLWMIVRDGETYFLVGLKSSSLSDHQNTRRLPRVVIWKDKLAHVVASLPRVVLQPEHNEVPSEDVFGVWSCHEVLLNPAKIIDLLLELKTQGLVLLLESHRALF